MNSRISSSRGAIFLLWVQRDLRTHLEHLKNLSYACNLDTYYGEILLLKALPRT